MSEKVDLIGIGPLLNSARAAMCAVTGDWPDEVVVEDASGKFLSAKLHTDWRRAGTRRLLGKTWDLRSAYRNLARTPSHSSVTIIAVWNPIAKKTDFHEQPVLPLGAASCVHSFGWVARSTYLVLSRGLWVLSGQYVDDFPTVDFAALCPSTETSISRLFSPEGTVSIQGRIRPARCHCRLAERWTKQGRIRRARCHCRWTPNSWRAANGPRQG